MGNYLRRSPLACWIAALIVGLATAAAAERRTLGILNQPAPGWEIAQWSQLPEGKTRLDIGDFKGKAVYLYCFQSW